MAHLDRRGFLAALPFVAAAPRLLAQRGAPPFRFRSFNHVTLTVSDLRRSMEFYQGLFGLPLQTQQGTQTATLRVGSGPHHVSLSTNPSSGVLTPRIDHMCIGVDGFDQDRLLRHLADQGVQKSEQRGPMRVQVRMRSAELGGDPSNTPEVYVGDPDGIMLQLQAAEYCAGSGPMGSVCEPPVPSKAKGLIPTVAFSHCTIASSDAQRSNRFYQQVFGLGIRSYQGPATPTLAVGPGVEFLVNSGRDPSRPIGIHHFCLTVQGFDTNRLTKALESFGLKARESQTGPVAPLRHYITMRMPDRGGAKAGTPELYFTDPDGLLVQLQDVTYCGGAGPLGEMCGQV